MQPASDIPAPQSPEGRRPVCIQSRFILCNSLRAVMDTSWFLSPNSSMCAKRGIYRHGSATESNTIISNPNLKFRERGARAGGLSRLPHFTSRQTTRTVLPGQILSSRSFSSTFLDKLNQNPFSLYRRETFKALHKVFLTCLSGSKAAHADSPHVSRLNGYQ